MPLGPALRRGEAADARGVHQCGIGRRNLLGDDDGAGRHARERLIAGAGQVAHEARACLTHIVDFAGEIGILHPGKGLGDLRKLHLNRRLGVDARLPDAGLDAAHEPRAGEHQQVCIEQVSQLTRDLLRQRLGRGLQAMDLRHGKGDRFAEACDFRLHRVILDTVFGHVDEAALDHMRRAYRDSCGDA